ncbi:hypothetical protein CQ13_16675 [Bradyrhizobium retamae]|uniref:Uncharacterized protein n=1 Tax=Bradyrhizobium retamae TaxID=1300035 RepID=A0A0R3NB15_9BRAD|nr:hypothetical protein CQ13_16675 [Bradyrhizobium retamae]
MRAQDCAISLGARPFYSLVSFLPGIKLAKIFLSESTKRRFMRNAMNKDKKVRSAADFTENF